MIDEIIALRQAAWTWADIGKWLGISPTVARKRYEDWEHNERYGEVEDELH